MRRLLPVYWLAGLLAAARAEEPLTLARALAMADAAHPAVALAQARAAAAEAELERVTADDDAALTLLGRLAWIEPSDLSVFQRQNDSSAHLLLEKRLYDFGYTEARTAAAESRVEAARASLVDARQRHRLKVMRAFFDVLLADLEHARDNEAMAVAYVRLDKAREKHALGRLSDLELMELEARYQRILSRRAASELRQRETRQALALALNLPDRVPAELVEPEPPDLERPLPDEEALLKSAMESNPELRRLQAEVAAAEQALAAAGRKYGPVLRGEVAAVYWNRETPATHPFEVALVLEMPLYRGGRDDAEVAAARSALMEAQARLALARHELRRELLQLRLEQERLKRRAQALDVRDQYRELYLDRSRVLYDMERATDLGDAMVQMSDVRLELARVHYQWMLNEARLRALVGRLLQKEEG